MTKKSNLFDEEEFMRRASIRPFRNKFNIDDEEETPKNFLFNLIQLTNGKLQQILLHSFKIN